MKRHRVRIQPYLSPEVHQNLRAHVVTRRLTESSVVGAALVEYLGRDQLKEDLVVRRLDGVTDGLADLRQEVTVVGQALANLAVYLFHAPRTEGREARVRADATYEDFLRTISRQLQIGMRLSGEVKRVARMSSRARAAATSKGGQ